MPVCNAHLILGDDHGDNDCTFKCQLEKGHSGPHNEKFRDGLCKMEWYEDDRVGNSYFCPVCLSRSWNNTLSASFTTKEHHTRVCAKCDTKYCSYCFCTDNTCTCFEDMMKDLEDTNAK
jgi:hypothetical protein